MPRIGVLGGSFDPVHRGHLFVALLARETAGLDRVIFVPAARPPHKTHRILASSRHRVAMLREALSDEPGTGISGIELGPEAPRYTVDTLGHLAGEHPGSSLVFVLGMDSLRDLGGWREPQRILEEFGVVAVDRPGQEIPALDPRFEPHCQLVRGNPFAISSTGIRRRVAAGHSIRHLVPDRVAEYIRTQGLYRTPDEPISPRS